MKNNKIKYKVYTITHNYQNLMESIKTLDNVKVTDYGYNYLIETIDSNKDKIESIFENFNVAKDDYEIVGKVENNPKRESVRPIRESITTRQLISKVFNKKDTIKESLDKMDIANDNKYDLRVLYESTQLSEEEISELEDMINNGADQEKIKKFLSKRSYRDIEIIDNTQLTNKDSFDELFGDIKDSTEIETEEEEDFTNESFSKRKSKRLTESKKDKRVDKDTVSELKIGDTLYDTTNIWTIVDMYETGNNSRKFKYFQFRSEDGRNIYGVPAHKIYGMKIKSSDKENNLAESKKIGEDILPENFNRSKRNMKFRRLKESKEVSLEDMIKSDKYSVNDCMEKYIYEYEDYDVMTEEDLLDTIDDLKKGTGEEKAQARRLTKLYKDSPEDVKFYDYENEKAITSKDFLKKKLRLKENINKKGMRNMKFKRLKESTNKYSELKPYLDIELEDDGTPYGGVSFAGETLRDFLDEVTDEDEEYPSSLKEVNKILKDCGIKPIKVKRDLKESRKNNKQNYRGVPEIEFVYHGEWADPELIYKGKSFNFWDIEGGLWEDFLEEHTEYKDSDSGNADTEREFTEYVRDRATDYLDDVIAGGYFNESLTESTSDTFQNLSDKEVERLYKEFKAKGMTEDEIFDEIYAIDCSKDDEEDLDESCKTRKNKRTLKESTNRRMRRPLNENTSNFSSMDDLPLLVFIDYEDNWEYYQKEVEEEFENTFSAEFDGKYQDFDKALEDYLDDHYDEIMEETENRFNDYYGKVCALTDEDIRKLEKDIEDFNSKTKNLSYDFYDQSRKIYNDWYYSEREKPFENEEEYNRLYDLSLALEDLTVSIKSGYYEGNQIYVDGYEYVPEDQLKRVKDFLMELKKKFGLTELNVAYRFSSGETGYSVVESLKATRRGMNFKKSLRESDKRSSKLAKLKRAVTELEKYENSISKEQLQKEKKDMNSKWHRLLTIADKMTAGVEEESAKEELDKLYNLKK